MRHEQLARIDSFNRVDIDRLSAAESARAGPAPAAQDVPVAVGAMLVAAYVILIATFALATTGSAFSHFIIAIDAVFLAAFFTVPWIFLKLEPKAGRAVRLDQFLRNGIQTFNGHSSGAAALVQMLIVPVMLIFGGAAMGVAAAIIM